MEEKEYLFMNLLLCLRIEYLKNKEQLESLKQYIQLYNEDRKNLYFSLLKPYFGGDTKLIITLFEKYGALEKVIDFLTEKFNFSIYPQVSGPLQLNSNNEYYVKNSNFPIRIKEGFRDEFEEKVSSILTSEFVTSINSYIDFGDYALSTNPSEIVFFDDSNRLSCCYSSSNDVISIASSDIFLSKEFIESLFEIKLPISVLPEYHQNLVKASPVFDKTFEITGNIHKKYGEFTITEDKEKVILKRK